jgi:hypothetical protein
MREFVQKPQAAEQTSSRKSPELVPAPSAHSTAAHSFGRMLRSRAIGIQTKLAISQPGDMYEQEADRVADQVMRMVHPASNHSEIQRECAECEDEQKASAQAAPALQTVEGADEEFPPVQPGVLFRKAEFTTAPSTHETESNIADRLAIRRGGGEALPDATRQSMESAFGYDFSRVRIHRDAEAGQISRQVSALAFTQGPDIYFAHGMYNPGDSSGRRLLAHELTHVVQQGQAHQAANPMIQRFANFDTVGTVHEVNNLAGAIVGGTFVGVTWPTLNGTQFWSRADARAAMNKPALKFSTQADGTINAEVDTIPDNIGSFDETVLAAGPWSTVAPKAAIGALHPSLVPCAGAGDSTFRAIGDPSDAAMFAANRRHENHHATDHEASYNASINPWDTKVFMAFILGTTFNGPTQADAEAALWTAMGGTPDDVADRYMDGCEAAVIAYHGTAAGGPVGAPTNPQSNVDCSTSSADYTNPS